MEKNSLSEHEVLFARVWETLAPRQPTPIREHRFAPPRRWRFDFAWPDWRVAVELEGGAWARGRHTRGAGYVADCEKYNAATLAGWRVLRYAGPMLDDMGQIVRDVLHLLGEGNQCP